MCGRVVSSTTLSVLAQRFAAELVVDSANDTAPSWNVAPTALLPAVAESPSSHTRRIGRMRWGLVPYWAEDPSIGNRLINARAETLTTKQAFREAFARRRCIVPVDAFYEWQRLDGRRQPYVIGRADEKPLAFAGLWESWRQPDQAEAEPLRTCTIITTDSNELVAPIHDRMPAILPPETWDEWLDLDNDDVDELQAMLRPPPADGLVAYRVGLRVNNVSNDGPELVAATA